MKCLTARHADIMLQQKCFFNKEILCTMFKWIPLACFTVQVVFPRKKKLHRRNRIYKSGRESVGKSGKNIFKWKEGKTLQDGLDKRLL